VYNGSQAEMNWINSVNPITSNDLYLFPERSLIIYSLHNATELMTWTHPAGCITQLCDFKVCTEYSGGMTGVAWRGIHRIMKMNTDNRFGFNNWRNPKGEEINAMFAGWSASSNSPGAFAKSQGFTSMGVERYIHTFYEPSFCWETINCEFNWVCEWGVEKYWDDNYGSWYYQTTDGKWSWLAWKSKNNLNFMPVRQIMNNEQYIW